MDANLLSQIFQEQTDTKTRLRLLQQNQGEINNALLQQLKDLADYFLRIDIHKSLEIAETMLAAAQKSGQNIHRALGLLAQANAVGIGLGEYEKAVELYQEASAIYREAGQPIEEARAQIGHVWALANVGKYEEAIALAQKASSVLEAAGAWVQLGKLTLNTAIIHGRQGNDAAALAMLDKAYAIFSRIDHQGREFLPWIEQNRSILLRNLGRLHESIAASEQALAGMDAMDQPIEIARAKQSLAVTYLVLGRYYEALSLMNEARQAFLNDGRVRDALLLDLYLSEFLLQLRRFREVTDITRNARAFFSQTGARQEMGKTLLNEAVAYAGMEQYQEALASLDEAREHFAADANQVWIAESDTQRAALLIHLNRLQEAEILLQNSENIFHHHKMPLKVAQVQIQQARIAWLQQNWQRTERLARQALHTAIAKESPVLAIQARHILGRVLHQQNDLWQAMSMYEQAIANLERLHGQLTVAFQADFLEDKTDIYEEAVKLALQMQRPAKALELAERAKSRSLLTSLANRVERNVKARSHADQALVQKLLHLRTERDRLTLRWETGEEQRAGGDTETTQHRIWQLEKEITQVWEKLLLRDAAYARDAMLWQVRAESPQPWLDDDLILLEYFSIGEQFLLFCISKDQIEVKKLKTDPTTIANLLNLLALNRKTLAWIPAPQHKTLLDNAQSLLEKLEKALLQPVRSIISAYPRIIIVPHGILHHIPFHALFDGKQYLIESHEISYLPASSLLRFVSEAHPRSGNNIILGYSNHHLLPHAISEARTVAQLMGGKLLVEEEATIAQVRKLAPQASLLHFATHGEFRIDSPHFSGLLLDDGWLTAIDIYNLRFSASLVTLSACSSGQNIIGGGDELLGLSRPFLYSGASSLLLSYWQLPDDRAEEFITLFYQELAAGQSKAAALRQAQLTFLHNSQEITYQHPYTWASFFLMGDPGKLHSNLEHSHDRK